jgi:hypothetical protein
MLTSYFAIRTVYYFSSDLPEIDYVDNDCDNSAVDPPDQSVLPCSSSEGQTTSHATDTPPIKQLLPLLPQHSPVSNFQCNEIPDSPVKARHRLRTEALSDYDDDTIEPPVKLRRLERSNVVKLPRRRWTQQVSYSAKAANLQ